MSAFNFQYYRGTFNPTDVYGAPAEPPFDVFARLGDRAWLAQQPQHYFVGLGRPEEYRAWRVPAALLKAGANEIAVTLERGQTAAVTYMDLALP